MDFVQARKNMIERQIMPYNVTQRSVLGLFDEVHREDFIPDEQRHLAFADIPAPLAHGQYTMTPKIEARLLQALELKTTDNVLEIGTGCAHLTALLAKSSHHVFSVDIHSVFIEQAEQKLGQYNIDNITLQSEDGLHGWQRFAPYDAIVLTGSVPILEEIIKEQLTINGRLFAVVGQSPVMEAVVVKRLADDIWQSETLFETELPALLGSEPVTVFQF